jgi:hypothetical protein
MKGKHIYVSSKWGWGGMGWGGGNFILTTAKKREICTLYFRHPAVTLKRKVLYKLSIKTL